MARGRPGGNPAFVKGMKKVGGRTKGSVNKYAGVGREFARRMLGDKEYLKSLRERLRRGKAPEIEKLLFLYAYGRPLEKIELTGADGGPIETIDRTDLTNTVLGRLVTVLRRTGEGDQSSPGNIDHDGAGSTPILLEADGTFKPDASTGAVVDLADSGGTRMGQGDRHNDSSTDAERLDDDGRNQDG